MADFSERFRLLRAAKGFSQQKLADLLNVSKSTVNMYERGERKPGIDQLEAIADFFNVDMDYLSGKTDVPRKYLDCEDIQESQSNSEQAEKISLNIIKYRKLKGLTQKEVAEYLGITQAGYSYYEHGKRALSFEIALKLSELFGVSTYFLGYIDNKQPINNEEIINENMSREFFLKEKIRKKGTNLKSIAIEIDVPYSTLRDMLHNFERARIDNVIKLCQYLGITVEELYTVKSSKFNLSEDEKQVITAYRNKYEMRAAVNKLLDIDADTDDL